MKKVIKFKDNKVNYDSVTNVPTNIDEKRKWIVVV
jgi:hypothetical protein